ncbi:reverse transcriptase, partial [Phytophthora megakarya]
TYEIFKEELKLVFETPRNDFRSRAEFLDLQQGKHDVHSYAQRARYLVSNVVTDPMDEATKVVTFMKGLRDGSVKTYLFRVYPSTLEPAITIAMHEEFSLRQGKLQTNVPHPPRPAVKTEGPEPMDLSYASAVGQQKNKGSDVRCFRCGNMGHYAHETAVETLNVLTRACTGYQYKKMELENPPTDTSELISLPVMSWKRFAKDLYDGRIEQLCILSDRERMTSEAEELRQLFADSATEKHKDVLPDEIPAELPQDKGIQHEIDLVPGTKYCVTRQWPLRRQQVKATDDFFKSRRKAGQVRESKSPHSAPTFCVKKPQGGWRILQAYNKPNDATIPAQTPTPRKDFIIDSMSKNTIYSALDLRGGFYQTLMRESDIPLVAVSTLSGMLWECLVMPQGRKNAPATFNSRAVDEKTDVEVHKEHLRKLLGLMRNHKIYANLKKCIFGASEIPVLGCLVGKHGVRPDPEKVRVINEWPTSSNVKELRQFLGLVTYLCKYVDNYPGKIRPLSQLLKKEAAWKWTADCQQAFEAVKLGLTEAPILAVADQDRPFHVVCDGSDFAIGYEAS